MKKLCFMMVAVLLSFTALAQIPSALMLQVENQSNCMQYYQVFGDEPCYCGTMYTSRLIAIPPGGIHTYTTSAGLGGSYPPGISKGMVGARIFDGPPACGTPVNVVGHAACGFPPIYHFMSFTSSCTPCGPATATWIEATNCEFMAQLIFNP